MLFPAPKGLAHGGDTVDDVSSDERLNSDGGKKRVKINLNSAP